MRIRRIKITRWRNFRDVEFVLADEAALVCLVGANGTGKTHVLELISACAHHIGLSPGIEIPRGNPFEDDDHAFAIEFYLAQGVSEAIDGGLADNPQWNNWDRTLELSSEKAPSRERIIEMRAGGIADVATSRNFARQVIERLRQSKDVYHLSLDADRAYPRRDLAAHEMAQAFETNWEDLGWTKGRSFVTTRTMYDEWIKYCLAKENKAANRFYQTARRAAEEKKSGPVFEDTFKEYRGSLRIVMPHLLFAGADQERKTILFDTANRELRFDQLSGGEREIAFLIGQIDRFGLKNGIFLLDEPELHLNPDLVRTWVVYLASTVGSGQVWLATHSLEAVEAAGQSATILIERDPETKLVNKMGRFSSAPVLSSLSRAVGTPAFSIAALRFVFVEGEEAIGERERFRNICDAGPDTRFVECGDCKEVARRVASITDLAREAGQPIRILGLIDRDWRDKKQLEQLAQQASLRVLSVHEVENFFLAPDTIIALAAQNGQAEFEYSAVLQGISDARSGGWILQSALSNPAAYEISNISAAAREKAYSLDWRGIEPDIEGSMQVISDLSGLVGEKKDKLKKYLVVYARVYARRRKAKDLWTSCEGKEVSKALARQMGYGDLPALERSIYALWKREPTLVPSEVTELRKHIGSV